MLNSLAEFVLLLCSSFGRLGIYFYVNTYFNCDHSTDTVTSNYNNFVKNRVSALKFLLAGFNFFKKVDFVRASQLTGFYMMTTLAFTELKEKLIEKN